MLDLDHAGAQTNADSIVGVLSHELVTSLAVVMGALHSFRKHHDKMPDDMRERLLDNAIESGTELAMLLEALLERFDEAVRDGIREGSRLPTS